MPSRSPARWPATTGARLLVLHVAREPVTGVITGVVPPEPERYHEECTEKLHQLVLENPHEPLETRLKLSANPATEFFRAAQDGNCDLIVMGSHWRTGLHRHVMGSVAEQVVRRASCPVLTVRGPVPGAKVAKEAMAERRATPLVEARIEGG